MPILRAALFLAAGLCLTRGGSGLLGQRIFYPRDPIVYESWVPDAASPSGVSKVSRVQEPDGIGMPLLSLVSGVLLLWLGFRAREDAIINRPEPYEGSWSDRRRKKLERENETRPRE